MGEGRVLQLLGPSTGGIRRHVAALSDALEARGWEVQLAGPSATLAALEPRRARSVVVPIPAGLRPVEALEAVLAQQRAQQSVDLVHAHGYKAVWVASLARHHPPLVLTVHNALLPGQGGVGRAVLGALQRVAARRADAVIATSADLVAVRGRSGAGADEVRVIPPFGPRPVVAVDAAEARAQLGVAPYVPLVVGIGRLHRQKAWSTLVVAAATLRTTVPDVQVLIVGEGPERHDLEGEIAEAGLDQLVRLAGPVANSGDVLAAADVLAVPSAWESGPLVVAEAMALGRPVVATPVGFVPDLIDDGRTGRIVPIGDPPALAEALAAVLQDPVAAEALGAAGRRRVAEVLDPDRLVAEVEAVYRSVLRRR
jgi:glycosyltransferase involved in cell wall biosynthesis